MLRVLIALLMSLVVTSCGPRYVDYFPYHDDGCSKPCVALIPVKDCVHPCLPWDVSEEFTQRCRYHFMDNAALYVVPPKTTDKILCRFSEDVDYFGDDLSFAKEFCNTEFVVVMELIEHQFVNYQRGCMKNLYAIRSSKCTSALSIKVRLRIIDLRCDEPEIILQEIVESNHMIPRGAECFDYNNMPWGCQGFSRTPLGLAHARMIKDIVNRVECVTRSAR